MKHLMVVGAGTGGTIVANRMRRRLGRDWAITVVDPDPTHLYQPGLLFLPFGAQDEHKMKRGRARTLRRGVRWLKEPVAAVDPAARAVELESGERLGYDFGVLATGARIRPDLVAGLEGEGWRDTAHEFYTLPGATALAARLANFSAGRLVVSVAEMPIKCPVAPLEFLFLADAFFRKRGVRDKIELVYATPLDGAFTRPVARAALGALLATKGIAVEAEFNVAEVDGTRSVLKSYDDREIPYDLLVSIPTHSGASLIARSGLGNELDFIPTDPGTLAIKGTKRLFALGDATDLPSSKAGSVAHFQAQGLELNLLRVIAGQPPEPLYDGHANCFVESGDGKALLLDFSYDVEPLRGRYPWPFGPFRLLGESRLNHLGKLAFRFLYWHGLLPGRWLPIGRKLSLRGKRRPPQLALAAT